VAGPHYQSGPPSPAEVPCHSPGTSGSSTPQSPHHQAAPPISPEEVQQDLQPMPIQQRSNAVFTAYHVVHAHNGIIYSDNDALRAYEALYQTLTARGCKPSLNILNNEASRAIKRAITKTGATYQLVKPHNHRVNAAERAIRTFKNHFIAGLCSTDPSFPVCLWDELVPQALLTLNLLRTSRLNPGLSAYNQLFGVFNFNRTPLIPPGTRALIFEDPDTRESWAPHGKLVW
jgi:hypothetical protein